MAVEYNEFEIPEPNPLDNLYTFIGIGNAQYFLDEHYREVTQSRLHRIGPLIFEKLGQQSFIHGPSGPSLFGRWY